MKWNRNCSFVSKLADPLIRKNLIYLNVHNSLLHEVKKTEICYPLKKKDHVFSTETKIGKRIADIVDWTDATIIEIQHTEPDESIRKKEEYFESLGFDFLRYRVI